MRQLIRPRQVAKALNVSLTTLWRWTKRDDFPTPFRLGINSVGYDVAEIETWLASRRVKREDVDAR